MNIQKLNGEDKEKKREKDRINYYKNKEYYNNHCKNYYEKNKEKIKARRRERYKLNNEYTKKT